MQISQASILKSLQGVAEVTKSPQEDIGPIEQLFKSQGITAKDGFPFDKWQRIIQETLEESDETKFHIASLALSVSFLRETCRQEQQASPQDLDRIWTIVHKALTSKNLSPSLFTANRSAQGLLAVPLCSLLRDGNIDELFRLHVWMPNDKRANPDFAIHSHQPFAQSWILAGKGVDHAYQVDPVDNVDKATHAGYALAWNDGKGQNADYKTHQSYSVVQNTGKLFNAAETSTEKHVRNDTYSIAAAAFHTSEVEPGQLHATLFFFDAHRGFVKDAGVLGPRDGESYQQSRDPAGITPAELAEAVEAERVEEAKRVEELS
ncbi:hypothetical protein CkaCkLH20_02364 [Colletotrichum karsti]|uniref:Uncharacterized protein n=1 Tax=Colletotrichum karsti TaxID=1095194 RepID=A0A9P6LP46_9PEZI|nr:uncharacterized protein CkaCkLH20_02364 [Colletotrichum karsti]KAF9880410.1 hypothetical protein CkaCkLH20_02364 [Colletotrichum karsti]